MTSSLAVHSHYYPPLDHAPGATALLVQVTALIDSYMIWVGSCDEIPGAELGASDQPKPIAPAQPQSSLADDSENQDLVGLQLEGAASKGDDSRVLDAIRNGRVSKDWACAMPVMNVRPGVDSEWQNSRLIMLPSDLPCHSP